MSGDINKRIAATREARQKTRARRSRLHGGGDPEGLEPDIELRPKINAYEHLEANGTITRDALLQLIMNLRDDMAGTRRAVLENVGRFTKQDERLTQHAQTIGEMQSVLAELQELRGKQQGASAAWRWGLRLLVVFIAAAEILQFGSDTSFAKIFTPLLRG